MNKFEKFTHSHRGVGQGWRKSTVYIDPESVVSIDYSSTNGITVGLSNGQTFILTDEKSVVMEKLKRAYGQL